MGLMEDLNNPDLFTENNPGEYEYGTHQYGKTARGQLCLADEPQRDSAAQRSAGGESRRAAGNPYGVDDGGHLIGARFGGATGEANLTAQDRNLNRSGYKAMEHSWAAHLQRGDKVFVHIESYDTNGADRPTNYMGYVIIEHSNENGQTSRSVEYISLNNESSAEHAAWNEQNAESERDHPEWVEADRTQNTAMPYIWDDSKQDVVPNPYFDSSEETTQKGPELTNSAAQNMDDGTDYTPGVESVGAAEETEHCYTVETDDNDITNSENTTDYTSAPTSGESAEAEADMGNDAGGQDME